MATQPRIELIFQNVEDRDAMFQSLKTDPHWQGKVKKGRSYIMRGKDRKRNRRDQNLISPHEIIAKLYHLLPSLQSLILIVITDFHYWKMNLDQ